MSLTTSPPSAPSDRDAAGGRARRRPLTLAIVVGLLVAVVATVLLTRHPPGRTAALDPDNPGPTGAQALARVLAQDGVDVQVVRSAAALDQAGVDSATTVVVTSTDDLGASTAARLLRDAEPGRLLLVQPSYAALDALGLTGLDPLSTAPLDVTGSCPDAFGGLLDGLRLQVDAADTYPSSPQAADCFAVDGRSVLTTSITPAGAEVTVLGAGEALGNDQVTRADDAALALRLLGHERRVVWYVPSPADLTAGDGVSVTSLLPRALGPGLLLVGLVVVALMLWRGRRLGPLATEPLPVVVRAIETTRSLGRLYRRSGDREHAAQALRRATRDRLAARLGLGPGADESAVVAATARQLGRGDGDVALLLATTAPPPATDHDLIRLAADLAELDREVRRA